VYNKLSIIDEEKQIIDETKPKMQYDADDRKVDRDERYERGIKKDE
jgi:hypothetical protein